MRPFEGFEDHHAESPDGQEPVPDGFRPSATSAPLTANPTTEFFFVFSRFEYAWNAPDL